MTNTRCERFFLFFSILFVAHTAYGDVSYSVPEEMKRGSVIGNIAKDLGLDVNRLSSRKARIDTEGNRKRYCDINLNTGELIVAERIDREGLCGKKSAPCVLQFQLLLENPLKVYSLLLDIQDINDNSPTFENGQIELELLESTDLGRRFPLESAHDPDIGANSVQHYQLSENEYFALEMYTQVDRNAYPELVLKKPLDRENQADHFLTLSGVDGGRPFRSGAASIHIHVLDANDNVPVFGQSVYKVSVQENSPRGTVLVKLNATDLDSGIYGEISYSFNHMPDKMRGVVEVDHVTGEVKVMVALDYEQASSHELDLQAKDGGGQSSHCKLIIDVIDVNDNSPVIVVKSTTSIVPEDASPGTMVALLHVYDLDTGTSGWVTCKISDDVPFKLVSEVKNYFMLVIDGVLDREKCPHYNITMTAVDAGTPPLFSSKTVAITITDVNDNPPIFKHSDYSIKFVENQPQGTLVIKVRAEDADEGQNARILYSLPEDAASHLSINAETGEIFTLRPFDYESSTHFHVQVMARDEGRPSFTSTCTVQIFIADQNDNAPVVLYPVQLDGYLAHDIVPRAAPADYLVTKVVVIDADAGYNAWLSYRIVKATQPNLFSIGLHCGEIRTLRPFAEGEEIKQTLIISVSDNGLESLSATATVNIIIEDGLPIIDELVAHDTDKLHGNSDLTLYLIMALAAMSSLFLVLIIAVVYMRLCRYRYICFNTLQKDDQYNSFLTTGSWKRDFRFGSDFVDLDMLNKRGTSLHVGGHSATRAKLLVPHKL
uniref:Cadherin domain-containing protein n=1 Tax=Cyprinus carpio TaxID=7962 RepID=A0A8C2EQL6_CYPCA